MKFPGEAPARNMFANVSDLACPNGIAQTHLLVKQDTRGLQNVLVILERQDRRVMPTRLQGQLSTKGCQLLPRMQWLPLGTSLALVNQDDAVHHLHAYLGDNSMFEADLPAVSSLKRRPLVVPGLYKINCDRHLWERAWIYVSPHDSVAVTDARGEFAMKNVPPGPYRVRLWHEGWTEKMNTRRLTAGRQARLEFQPMQQMGEIQVRENVETRAVFDNLSPAFAVTSAD